MRKLLAFTGVLFIPLAGITQNEQKNDSINEAKKTEILKEIVLSSNILGSKFEVKNRTGSAYYLSPQDLQQFGYTDANKILRAVPGVNVFEEDGFGLRPNISLRGTSPERSSKITLMEDGVLIAPAPYSAPAAYYFPTMGRIEAIEVLKGSSQVQYGPFTTGGAINMVSKSIPRDFSGDVRFSYGNYNSRSTEATLGDSGKNFGFVTQYYNYNSDGFKSLDTGGNTGFDKSDYLGKFRLNTNHDTKVFQSLTFKIQYSEETSNETYLGLTQEDFDNDPYRRYIASSADQMNTEHWQFQLDHLIKPLQNVSLRTTAYHNKFSRNWYKLNDVNLGETISIGNILADPLTYNNEYQALLGITNTAEDVFGIKANNRSYDSKGIQTVANINFGNRLYQNLEIGVRYHEDSEDRFQWKDKFAIQNGEMIRTTVAQKGSDSNRITSAEAIAAHALYKVVFNGLTLTPGVRYETITLTRNDYGKEDPTRLGTDLTIKENNVNVWIPGIGANYKFNNALSLFGGVHKGFAPPGTTEGSDSEESINLELGSRFNFNGLRGELVGFYNDYDNLLGSDLAASGGTGSLDQFNAGQATVKGIELLLNYDLLQASSGKLKLPITLSYTFTDAQFQSDFDSEVGIFGEVNSGDEIPYIAKNQFNVTAALENSNFNVSLSGRYTDALRTEAGSGSIPDEFKIGSNFIVDMSAKYFYSERVTIFSNINNLFDSKYEVARLPAGLRPGAPFMVNAGIGYSF
ncbi:TonB-dependent receptor family protein [Planktosalinus lacus]|uniref:TonB-dependent receptor n=1 Tax=Planktosalinus lacus TaxID=1526573 RepID=A0A8J2Y6L9_9FLAO|nr:TonB-dependent receptor [Planktosalinus lacus]GGD92164.1 TonB-dependent receptor [Planktosalinus lacus]